jgi:hypothetical protein
VQPPVRDPHPTQPGTQAIRTRSRWRRGPTQPALLAQRPRQRLHDRRGDPGGEPQKPREGTHQAAVADCVDARGQELPRDRPRGGVS